MLPTVWGKVKHWDLGHRPYVLSPLRTNLCEFFFNIYNATQAPWYIFILIGVIYQTVWHPWLNLEIYLRNLIADSNIPLTMKNDYTGSDNIVFIFTVFPKVEISWIQALTELMPRDSAQNNFRNKLLQVLNRIIEKQHQSYEPKWRIRRFK